MRKKNAVFRSITSSLLALCMIASVVPAANVRASSDTSSESVSESESLDVPEVPTDISGKPRLIVSTDHLSFLHKGTVLSEYDGTYLIQYNSEKDAEEEYEKYSKSADFVAYDSEVKAADKEDDSAASSDADVKTDETSSKGSGTDSETESSESGEDTESGGAMTKKDNPLASLKSELKENPDKISGRNNTIALIDTGVDSTVRNVVESVSMIGGDGEDVNGHGSNMGRTINESNGNANILSIKALKDDGTGDASAIYAGIEYAIAKKADIINLSLFGNKTAKNSAIVQAVKEAYDAGIIVVGAAGNEGKDAEYYVPGCIDKEAYIIGAAGINGRRLESSNYGDTVDYNVIASSTSYAAARFSGMLSTWDLSNRKLLTSEIETSGVALDPADTEKEQETDTDDDIDISPNKIPKEFDAKYKLAHDTDDGAIADIWKSYHDIVISSKGNGTLSYFGNDTRRKYQALEDSIIALRIDLSSASGVDITAADAETGAKDNLKSVLSVNDDGSYILSFVVPDHDVNIKASFTDDSSGVSVNGDKMSSGSGRISSNGLVVENGYIVKYPASVVGESSVKDYTVESEDSLKDRLMMFRQSQKTVSEGVRAADTQTVTNTRWELYTSSNPSYRTGHYTAGGNTAFCGTAGDKGLSEGASQSVSFREVSDSYGKQVMEIKMLIYAYDHGMTSSLLSSTNNYAVTHACISALWSGDTTGCQTAGFNFSTLKGKLDGASYAGTNYDDTYNSLYRNASSYKLYVGSLGNGKQNILYGVADAEPKSAYGIGTDLQKTVNGKNAGPASFDVEFRVYNRGGKGYTGWTPKKSVTTDNNGRLSADTLNSWNLYGNSLGDPVYGEDDSVRFTRWSQVHSADGQPGQIRITETKAPANSKLNPTPKVIDVDLLRGTAEGSGSRMYRKRSGGAATFENSPTALPKGAKVIVKKVDKASNEPVSGASFVLYDGKDNGRAAEAVSGSDGLAVFTEYQDYAGTTQTGHKPGDKLVNGHQYLVKEEKAPTGYKIDDTSKKTVTASESDTAVAFTFTDTLTGPPPGKTTNYRLTPVTRSSSGTESAGFSVNITKRNYHNPSYIADLAGFKFRIQAGSHDDVVTTDDKGSASQSYPGEWSESWSVTSDTYYYISQCDDSTKSDAEAECKAQNPGGEVFWSESDAAAAAQSDCDSKASSASSSAYSSVMGNSASVTVTEISTPAKGGWLLDSTPHTGSASAGSSASFTVYNKQRPPKVKTRSMDVSTGDHVGQSIQTTASINDTVNCTDLIEGHSYTITGTLSTGETTYEAFTAKAEKETHTMSFICHQADRQNKTVYVTENIVDNVTKLTGKDGGSDNYPDQTVRYPRVGTTAIDNDTKDDVGTVKNDAKIVDTVRYANLWTNGTKYRIEGTAYDVSTKKALADSSAEFTPSNKDGSQDLTFTLDTRSLGGHDVVIFEKLFYISNNKKVEIAHHEDWNDQGQTIHYPKVGTTALDEKTNRHDGLIQDTNTLIDTVHIENAVIGKTYTVTGKLYDQSNSKPLTVDGKEITATAQVTPTAKNVDVKVPFTFKYVESLYGRNFVAFEDLIHNNIKVATHSEINDKEQTVWYPTAVKVRKEDYDHTAVKATGKYVAGATFKLFTKDGNTYHAVRKDKTGKTYRWGENGYTSAEDYAVMTGSDGYARFDNLAVAEFYVHETKAPSGYVQNDTYLRLDGKVGEINKMDYHNSTLTQTFLATGGRGVMMFYAIAAIAAAAIAAASAYYIHSRRKKTMHKR